MVRASLVKSDALMRALGRPNRDQIVSMRPSDLTTLEAIDLANGETLATAIERGARPSWLPASNQIPRRHRQTPLPRRPLPPPHHRRARRRHPNARPRPHRRIHPRPPLGPPHAARISTRALITL